MTILSCVCKCRKSTIVSKRGMSFQAGKIKEVCWNDGTGYQGFLSYKKTVSNTGQEHEEYRHTPETLQV